MVMGPRRPAAWCFRTGVATVTRPAAGAPLTRRPRLGAIAEVEGTGTEVITVRGATSRFFVRVDARLILFRVGISQDQAQRSPHFII